MKKYIFILLFLVVVIISTSCKEEVKVKDEDEGLDKYVKTSAYSFLPAEDWVVEKSEEEFIDYLIKSPDNRNFIVITFIPDMGHHGDVFIANDIEFMKKNDFEFLEKRELYINDEGVEGTFLRYIGSTTDKLEKRYYESYIYTKGYEGILIGINYPARYDMVKELEEFISSFLPFPE